MRFTRARYQKGSLIREERKVGPHVWIFRWREQTLEGRVKRKVVVGTVHQYRSKAVAQKAAETLRAAINKETWMPSTVEQLVDHYTERELPSRATPPVECTEATFAIGSCRTGGPVRYQT
jgi:hypothetical protein